MSLSYNLDLSPTPTERVKIYSELGIGGVIYMAKGFAVTVAVCRRLFRHTARQMNSGEPLDVPAARLHRSGLAGNGSGFLLFFVGFRVNTITISQQCSCSWCQRVAHTTAPLGFGPRALGCPGLR